MRMPAWIGRALGRKTPQGNVTVLTAEDESRERAVRHLADEAARAQELEARRLGRPAHEAIQLMDDFMRRSADGGSPFAGHHFAWQYLRQVLTNGGKTPDGRQILPAGWSLHVTEAAEGDVPHLRLFGPNCFFAKPMDGEAGGQIAAKLKLALRMQP